MNHVSIRNLRNLLAKLEAEDPGYRVYGSEQHKYRIGPPLPEHELRAFEQEHRVILPPDYRQFLKLAGTGAGPGHGVRPLNGSATECDPGRPFPLTVSCRNEPVTAPDAWGETEKWPGVVELSYGGCAFFSYLVVNGATYGTVWEADVDLRTFFPTGLSFESWYGRWITMLEDRALPILANESIVAQIEVGMTKSQVVDICGGDWKQSPFGEQNSFLRFEHLATQFELDAREVVIGVVRHKI
jgi:hypothetical protein